MNGAYWQGSGAYWLSLDENGAVVGPNGHVVAGRVEALHKSRDVLAVTGKYISLTSPP